MSDERGIRGGVPSAVLWDLDGTLLDSEPLWRKIKLDFLKQLGLELSPETIDATIGTHASVWIEEWTRLAGMPLDLEAAHEEILSSMVDGISPEMTVTGARDVLEHITSLGIPQALVSSSSRRLVDAGLLVLGNWFALSVAAQDVVNLKPAPDAYLLAAQRLGVLPSTCLVVEDSRAGASSGVAAGCRVLLVGGHIQGEVPGVWGFVPALSQMDLAELFGSAQSTSGS